jgi:hypothetical protein
MAADVVRTFTALSNRSATDRRVAHYGFYALFGLFKLKCTCSTAHTEDPQLYSARRSGLIFRKGEAMINKLIRLSSETVRTIY